MAFQRKHVLWSLLGNTPSIGNGAHLWFSAVAGGTDGKGTITTRDGTFISDSTNVPVNAWFVIPCRHSETLLLGWNALPTALISGDRPITTSLLRIGALGMPYYNPDDTKFSKPAVARAAFAVASVPPAAELSSLAIVHNNTLAGPGYVFEHKWNVSVIPSNAFLRDSASVPAATDTVDWWLQIGKRNNNMVDPLLGSTVMPIQELSVKGLQAVAIALKFVPTAAGGTTDDVIAINAELFAILDGPRQANDQ